MLIKKDSFNSEIFGLKMGNVELDNPILNYKQFITEEKAFLNDFEHLSLKIDSNNKQLFNYAIASGYYLVDTLIEYIFTKNKSILPKINHKCELRDYQINDLKDLKNIAKNSFEIDRFHSDKNLSRERCDLYYEKWVENSCNGFADKVIVATYKDEIVGFTTGKNYENDELGHLVLSAVSNKYRGLGIYTSMIYEGVSWILNDFQFKKGILVGTQLNNIAVQKAWIKLGFSVFKSTYVLHKYLGRK